MTWLLIRLAFAVGIAAAVAWFMRSLDGGVVSAGLAALLTGAGFFVLLTSVGGAFDRMDRILADANAESQALSPLRPDADDEPVMTKRVERVDPFDNVPELLTSAAVERRTDVLAEWRRRHGYRGSRRVGVKR